MLALAIGPTELAPIVAALGAVVTGRFWGRALRGERAAVWSGPLSIAAGFCAGWLTLFSPRELVPTRSVHWLFYLAIGAALVGPLASGGLARRALAYATAAVAAAWLLVPTWANLDPPRTIWIPALAAGLWLIAMLTEPLARRVSPAAVVLGMIATAALLAALVAGIYDITTGATAGIAVAAMAGWLAVTRGTALDEGASSIAILYSLLIGGVAFAAGVYPQPPVLSLFVIPAAPLAIWICGNALRSSPGGNWRRMGAPLLAVALTLGAIGAWIAVRSSQTASDAEEW